jgi:hypothetical protein|tara:strand:+ start:3168 stop:3545 length:378 start_codon:yes stop_codon:yes gene_type:complete
MSNLKDYCQSCGSAHSYTLRKPNFCQSCGISLGSAKKDSRNALGLEIEEESAIPGSFSDLEGLEFDSEVYSPDSQTLGSIMQQYSASPPPSQHSSQRKPKNPFSTEEILEQLKKESSAIRPKTSK